MILPKLYVEEIKQEAWYKQIKDDIKISKRKIDEMSLNQIHLMYEKNEFLCDICGNKLPRSDTALKDHIIHLINPMCYWHCEDCFVKQWKLGNILGMEEEKITQAQLEYR